MVLYNKPVPLKSPTLTPEQVKQETSQNLPSGISLHIPQKSAMGPQTPGQPIPMAQPKQEVPVVSQPQDRKPIIEGMTIEKEEQLKQMINHSYANFDDQYKINKFKELANQYVQQQQASGQLRGGVRGSVATLPEQTGAMGFLNKLNPVGRLFERIDDATRTGIPEVEIGKKREKKVQAKVEGLQQSSIDHYTKLFNEKSAMGKVRRFLYGNVENFITESQKTLGDVALGDFETVPEMVANTPGSTAKVFTAISRAVTNPLDTVVGITKLIGTKEGRQALKYRYGSEEGFYDALTKDPVGVASDFLTIVQFGAGGTAKLARLSGQKTLAQKAGGVARTAEAAADLGVTTGFGKVPSLVGGLKMGADALKQLPVVGKPLSKAANIAIAPTRPLQTLSEATEVTPGKVGFIDRALSSWTGLDAETVNTMRSYRRLMRAVDNGTLNKEMIKDELQNAINQAGGQKKEVGGLYQEVYKDPTRFSATDIIDDINNSLTEQGVIIKGNKIVGFDTTKMTGLNDSGKNALKSKYNDVIATLKRKTDISVEELHNIRKDVYGAAYTDGFKTKKAPGVMKVSDVLNERLKQVPGFKEVDAGYKEAADLMQELRSAIETKQGDFRGTLKSLLGERGAKRLDILEKHFPGLKDQIKAIAAYDDYLYTREHKKVGLYEKGGFLAAAGAGYLGRGPIGGVVAAFVSPIVRDFITDPVWFKRYILATAGKDIADKMSVGATLSSAEQKLLRQHIETLVNEPNTIPDFKEKYKALPYEGPTQIPPGELPKTLPTEPAPQTPISRNIRETGQENVRQPGTTKPTEPTQEPIQPKEQAPVEKQPTANEKFYNELETKPITDVSKFRKGMQTPDGEIIQVGFNGPRAFFRVKGDKPYSYRYSGEAKALPKPKVDEKANLETMVDQGQRRSLYTKQALEDLGVASLDDLDAPQIQELAQLIRARNFDDKWYARWEKLKADVQKDIKTPEKKEISNTQPVQLNKVSNEKTIKPEGLFADVDKPKTKPLPKPKQEKVQLEERKPVESMSKEQAVKKIDNILSQYSGYGKNNSYVIQQKIIKDVGENNLKPLFDSLGINSTEGFDRYLKSRNASIRPGLNKQRRNELEEAKDKVFAEVMTEKVKLAKAESDKGLKQYNDAIKEYEKLTGKKFDTTGPESPQHALERVKKENKGLEEKAKDPKAGKLTADGYSGVKEKVIDGIKVTSKKDSGEYARITFEYKGKEYNELVSRRIKEDFDTSNTFYTNYNVIDDRTIKSIIETTKRIEDGREQVIRDYPSLKDAKGTMLKFHFEDYMGKYGTKPLTPEVAFKNAILEIGPDAKSWLEKRGNYTEKDVMTDTVKESINAGKITREQAFAEAERLKQQKQTIADLYDKYSKQPIKKEAKVGLGNRRDIYKREGGQQDGMRGADILRAIAEDSKSSKELSDVLDRVKEYPEGQNITRAVSKNPNASKEVKARAMKMYDSYGKPTKGLTKTKSEGLFTKEDVKTDKVKVKQLKDNDYIISGKEKDYRVNIYTDGYKVEEGAFVDFGGGKYNRETQGKIVKEVDRKIVRNKKSIKNILEEVVKELTETPKKEVGLSTNKMKKEKKTPLAEKEPVKLEESNVTKNTQKKVTKEDLLKQEQEAIAKNWEKISELIEEEKQLKAKKEAIRESLKDSEGKYSPLEANKKISDEGITKREEQIRQEKRQLDVNPKIEQELQKFEDDIRLFDRRQVGNGLYIVTDSKLGVTEDGRVISLPFQDKSKYSLLLAKSGVDPIESILKITDSVENNLQKIDSNISKEIREKYNLSNKYDVLPEHKKEYIENLTKAIRQELGYDKKIGLKKQDTDLAPGEVRDTRTGIRMLKEEKEFFDELDEVRPTRSNPKEYKGYTIERHQEGRMGNKTETYAIRKGQELIKTIPVEQGKDIKSFIDGLVEKETKKVGLEKQIEATKSQQKMKRDIAESKEKPAVPLKNEPDVLQGLEKDITYDEGYNAHRNTSFSPEKRAEQEIASYADGLRSDYEQLRKYATTPEKQEILDTEFARYRDKMQQMTKDVLYKKSQTLSSMITGPARFPTARNQKKLNALENAQQKMRDYQEKAKKAIKRKLTPEQQPIKATDENAIERLEKKLIGLKQSHEQMKGLNKVYKQGKVALKEKMEEYGRKEKTINAVLDNVKEGEKPFAGYQLSNNNANIKTTEKRLNQLKRMEEKAKETGGQQEVQIADSLKVEGMKAINNYEAKRLQLIFDGKPDAKIRDILKSHGFKWSPKNNARQRFLNNNSTWNLKKVLEKIRDLSNNTQ